MHLFKSLLLASAAILATNAAPALLEPRGLVQTTLANGVYTVQNAMSGTILYWYPPTGKTRGSAGDANPSSQLYIWKFTAIPDMPNYFIIQNNGTKASIDAPTADQPVLSTQGTLQEPPPSAQWKLYKRESTGNYVIGLTLDLAAGAPEAEVLGWSHNHNGLNQQWKLRYYK